MVKLKVNDGSVRQLLAELEGNAADLSDAMQEIGMYIVSHTMERFEREGPGWPPLSPATLRSRRRGRVSAARRLMDRIISSMTGRSVLSPKILQDTGRLKASIGAPSHEGVFRVGSREVVVGTNVPYAAIHQFGTNRAGRSHSVHIPARPFLVVEDDDVSVMEEIIRQYILMGGR